MYLTIYNIEDWLTIYIYLHTVEENKRAHLRLRQNKVK